MTQREMNWPNQQMRRLPMPQGRHPQLNKNMLVRRHQRLNMFQLNPETQKKNQMLPPQKKGIPSKEQE